MCWYDTVIRYETFGSLSKLPKNCRWIGRLVRIIRIWVHGWTRWKLRFETKVSIEIWNYLRNLSSKTTEYMILNGVWLSLTDWLNLLGLRFRQAVLQRLQLRPNIVEIALDPQSSQSFRHLCEALSGVDGVWIVFVLRLMCAYGIYDTGMIWYDVTEDADFSLYQRFKSLSETFWRMKPPGL